jgi:hypothetical protein
MKIRCSLLAGKIKQVIYVKIPYIGACRTFGNSYIIQFPRSRFNVSYIAAFRLILINTVPDICQYAR